MAVPVSRGASRRSPSPLRVVGGNKELRGDQRFPRHRQRPLEKRDAHHWGKAVSRRVLHLLRRENWPVDLSSGLYFVFPWATSQANINERKPLKRNKHLSKTYLFFMAKQLLMGFVASLEKLKGKQDLRSPLAVAEGNCRTCRAVSQTSAHTGTK